MKKFYSKYPLGQLLIAMLAESGLNLPDFLRSIGYRNVAKGVRHFREFLTEGLGSNVLMTRALNSPFAPSFSAFSMICQQNMEQLDLEYSSGGDVTLEWDESDFAPLVHAVPALPEIGSVSCVALAGEFSPYTVHIESSVARLSKDLQTKFIGRLIRRNYRANKGIIECLGPISYYLYYPSYEDPPEAFSVQGTSLGACDTAFLAPRDLRKQNRAFDEALLGRLLNWRGDLPLN